MTFFEGGCRVPLIVHRPARFRAQRVKDSVSHLDLLPTLVELARGTAPQVWPDSIDGQSLVPHLTQTGGHDEAIGEYLAEGAIAPIVMIRRGRCSFIRAPIPTSSTTSRPIRSNATTSRPMHVMRRWSHRFARRSTRWNLAALHEDVLKSQRRRHFHFNATTQGV